MHLSKENDWTSNEAMQAMEQSGYDWSQSPLASVFQEYINNRK